MRRLYSVLSNLASSLSDLRLWIRGLSKWAKAAIVFAVTVLLTPLITASIILGGVNDAVTLSGTLRGLFGDTGNLELVDTSFGTQEDPYARVLDVKISNTSDSTSFIKRADFRIEKVWTIAPPYRGDTFPPSGGYAAPSYKYEVTLPLSKTTKTISKSTSQSIAPGDVDRFQFALYPQLKGSNKDYVLLINMNLIYDADDKSLSRNAVFATSDDTVLEFYDPEQGYGPTSGLSQGEADNLAEKNEEYIRQIAKIEAPKNQYFRDLSEATAQP